MLRVALLLAFLLGPALAEAQAPPIRWGRITDAEVALTGVPDDPDAGAVVLGDVGFAEIRLAGDRENFEYEMRRHRRVKVLKESGYAQGEFALRFGEGADIRGVKGQTFVPQPDGSLRRVDLESRSIREEAVRDGVREVRFSMPALAPGAIFEVEYTYKSESYLAPPAWYFQSDEPTLVSEYRFEVPEYFVYAFVTQGGRVTGGQAEPVNRMDWGASAHRWSAENVPALREEPYTTIEEDYANKVEMQLQQLRPPNGLVRNVLSSWETVAQELQDNPSFGRRLRRNRRVEEAAAGLVGATHDETARAAYDLVRTGYVWNREGGIFAERDLDAVVETRSGSHAELNLLLLALLREAGVPATPVLLSTRSNGRAIQSYPVLSRFNYLGVLVEPDGAPPQILDATDPQRPYGYLPVEALSGAMWLADPARARWVSFTAPAGTATTSIVQGAVGEDGRVEGTLRLQLTGYAALAARQRIAAGASDEGVGGAEAAAAEAADAPEAFHLDDVSVDGVEAVDGPLTMEATFTSAAGEAVADEIYLPPFLVMQLDENPFQRAARDFPVDFAYPSTRSYVASVVLPEGYAVEETPAPVRLAIPSGAVTYTRLAGVSDGVLQVRAVLRVAASEVMPSEYPALRQLYDEIVAAETESVVLVRGADAPPPTSTDAATGDE